VAPGTKFLVRLDEELGTKGTQANARFKVKTLEPLEAGSGVYLPAGAEIRGHISHVEPAGVAGRAKLWLTLMKSIPGSAICQSWPKSWTCRDHSVKSGPRRKDSSKAGAARNRMRRKRPRWRSNRRGKGVKDKDKKGGSRGAALGP